MKFEKIPEPIYVTQPFLPPLNEFFPYLEEIWENKKITNGGPFHHQLEEALCEYLGVKHLSLFTNGTIALVTALQALRVSGEVITTPYSFVATSHSIMWNGLQPVFVDIDTETFNLDTKKIEQAITPRTTAILPVHCYGRPCEVEEIQRLADTYGLKVIYDAAHAFGVKYKNESVLNFGDLSILSFHATKVFNTFEGGAIISNDAKTKQRIDYLKNYGFVDEITITATGINGKLSEVNAAFGMLQLKYIEKVLERRSEIEKIYQNLLANTVGIKLLPNPKYSETNSSYFPILVTSDYHLNRDDLYNKLKANGVFARRYFFPLISDMPMYRGLASAKPELLPNAKKIANQVLCLPIYPNLKNEEVVRITDIIKY